MKPFSTKILLLLGLMFCLCTLHAQNKIKFTTLKPAKFKAQIEQAANPNIIDVRSSDADFEAGHIAGATHLAATNVQFILEIKRRYSENDSIFVYCRTGSTSKYASTILVSNGFTNIYNLKEGILGWVKKFPIVTD